MEVSDVVGPVFTTLEKVLDVILKTAAEKGVYLNIDMKDIMAADIVDCGISTVYEVMLKNGLVIRVNNDSKEKRLYVTRVSANDSLVLGDC